MHRWGSSHSQFKSDGTFLESIAKWRALLITVSEQHYIKINNQFIKREHDPLLIVTKIWSLTTPFVSSDWTRRYFHRITIMCFITMASYERHCASNHWEIESWFNSLFGLRKTHQSPPPPPPPPPPALLTLYEGNSVYSGTRAVSYHVQLARWVPDHENSSADRADVGSCIQTRSLQMKRCVTVLIHEGRDMATNIQTIFKCILWIKIIAYWLQIIEKLWCKVT